MMDRRSFFGAAAAALAGAPAIADAVIKSPASMQALSVAFDGAPLAAAIENMQTSVLGVSRSFLPMQWQRDKEYIYRTGNPAIDALKSVSGVHRALMEKRSAI